MTARHQRTPDRVIFFGTCLIDLLYPSAGLAAMRLLRGAGLRVSFPQAQTCCGQPAYNAGFRDEARRVARQQLDVLAGDSTVVVPSASCAGMLREHYPRLFAGTAEESAAVQLAGRVVELCDFLDRVLDVQLTDHGPPLTVALHHSCSARREMGVAPAAARLLGRLRNVSVLEPDHAHECCGFGGTFAVKEPGISAKMGQDRLDDHEEHGVEVITGADMSCLMHLDGLIRKKRIPLEVKHLSEILYQS